MSTARAGTETEAANIAIGHCGRALIADIGDDNIRARACRQFFGLVRDSLLREKWWSFAAAWVRPSRDPVDSIGPLARRFVMPADCLRIRYVKDAEEGEWDKEGGMVDSAGVQAQSEVLVTNIESPLVSYTRRIVEVRVWDPIFLDAFCYELAGRIARKMARSESFAAGMRAQARDLIGSASTIDSKEQAPQRQSRDAAEPSYLSARRGFRSSDPYR